MLLLEWCVWLGFRIVWIKLNQILLCDWSRASKIWCPLLLSRCVPCGNKSLIDQACTRSRSGPILASLFFCDSALVQKTRKNITWPTSSDHVRTGPNNLYFVCCTRKAMFSCFSDISRKIYWYQYTIQILRKLKEITWTLCEIQPQTFSIHWRVSIKSCMNEAIQIARKVTVKAWS